MARPGVNLPDAGILPLGDLWRSFAMEASVTRSSLADADLEHLIHNGGSSHTQLWWGPMVPVHDGDLVRYFKTPSGRIAVESVTTPPPKPA